MRPPWVTEGLEFGRGGLLGASAPALGRGSISWPVPRSRGLSVQGCHQPSPALLNILLVGARAHLGRAGEQGQHSAVRERTLSRGPAWEETLRSYTEDRLKHSCPGHVPP